MSVVVIEDNADLAYMLAYLLDYEIPGSRTQTVVRDFADEVFRSELWEEVDVAVVDIMLPEVDGRHILRWLERTYPNIRRVAWTAMPLDLLRDDEAIQRAHVVVQKPSQPTLVIDAIRSN